MMSRPWYAPQPAFKRSKGGALTCRSCGAPPHRCVHCQSPMCITCQGVDHCPHCQRPQ